MKRKYNLRVLSLLVLAALLMSLFAACGGGTTGGETGASAGDPGTVYKVNVCDALGNPCTGGIAVKFMKGDVQAGMQIVSDSGVAEKNLSPDNYTVQLHFTDPDLVYAYDMADNTLTPDKTELTVVLYQTLGEEKLSLFADGKDQEVYYVTAGCTKISLNPDGRTYFIFRAQEPGTYEISLSGSDAGIAYYGESHYIHDDDSYKIDGNKLKMSVSEDMLGGTPVIGVDAAQGDAMLCINRVGEAEWTIEQEPWTVYETTAEVKPYTLPAGSTLNKFDIKASSDSYALVYNEQDGYYHLGTAEGALVLVVLANGQEKLEYIDTVEEIQKNYGLRRIFYDESGNFVKKEGYTECLTEYIEACDKTYGVYPLTKDLKYIIEQVGIQQGWFDKDNPSYIFEDENGVSLPDINPEISWLFMCRYL